MSPSDVKQALYRSISGFASPKDFCFHPLGSTVPFRICQRRYQALISKNTPLPCSPVFWTDSHVLLGAWESGVRTPTPKPTPTATPRTPRAKIPREEKSAFSPAPADGAPDKIQFRLIEAISSVLFVDMLLRPCRRKTMRVGAGNRRGTAGERREP